MVRSSVVVVSLVDLDDSPSLALRENLGKLVAVNSVSK